MPTIKKSDDAFRTIAEVSAMLGVEQHALRYWESQFKQVRPVKRKGNRRLYRRSDIRLIAGLKKLLHEDNYTLKGAQKILGQKGIEHVASLGSEYLQERGLTEDESGKVEEGSPEVGGAEGASPGPPPEEDVAVAAIPASEPVDAAVPPEEETPAEAEPPAEIAEVDPTTADSGTEVPVDSFETDLPDGGAEAELPDRDRPETGSESIPTANVSARGHEISISPDVINELSPADLQHVRQLVGRLEELRDRARNDIRHLRSKFGLASDP